jgi:predicted Zn-dependent protease with MMP-like domain
MKAQNMKQIAARELKSLIGRLPADLRAKIENVTIILQARPDRNQLADGIEADTLGLFIGPALPDGDESAPLPPRIVLFLENIGAEAQDGGRGYPAELRRTFLHELGHYLGLDEDDLVLRDVD